MRASEPVICEPATWLTRRLASTAFPSALRGLGLAICLGVCVANGAARAQDAQDGDELKDRFMRAFSLDKIGELTGLRKTEQEKQSAIIDYRERSPLVVPKTRDLPPPQTGNSAAATPTNWPRDPGTNRKTTAGHVVAVTQQPGTSDLDPPHAPLYDPSDWTWQNIFSGKKKAESVPFKSEPARDSLTQPPPGYQTPSPDYAYGTGGPPSGEQQASTQPSAPAGGAK